MFAIYLKSRDKMVKDIALPSIITGFFGTTEPAIYGVTLPRTKLFVFSCIGAAVGGGLASALGGRIFIPGYSGIMALMRYLDPTGAYGIEVLFAGAVGMASAALVGFVFTWFFWDERAYEEEHTK